MAQKFGVVIENSLHCYFVAVTQRAVEIDVEIGVAVAHQSVAPSLTSSSSSAPAAGIQSPWDHPSKHKASIEGAAL